MQQVNLTPDTYKTSLDTSSLPKPLPLNCKQINRVKNKVDGEPSGLLAYMKLTDSNAFGVSVTRYISLSLGFRRFHL